MYKNEEYLKNTPEQMIFYIRKKHKKFEAELPAQLQKWVDMQSLSKFPLTPSIHVEEKVATEKFEKDSIELSDACKKEIEEDIDRKTKEIMSKIPISFVDNRKTARMNIAVKLLCSINPGREDAASAVDYAVELTDELLKRMEE